MKHYNENLTEEQVAFLKEILSWIRFIEQAYPECMLREEAS